MQNLLNTPAKTWITRLWSSRTAANRQVAQQIRAAQQKAALSGQAPLAWAIGARCQAVWSGDGGWYNGTVSGVSVNDRFIVTFDEDGGVEEVHIVIKLLHRLTWTAAGCRTGLWEAAMCMRDPAAYR